MAAPHRSAGAQKKAHAGAVAGDYCERRRRDTSGSATLLVITITPAATPDRRRETSRRSYHAGANLSLRSRPLESPGHFATRDDS